MGFSRSVERDRAYLEALGITPEQIRNQIRIFERGCVFLTIARPCRPGDGIERLGEERMDACLNHYKTAAAQGRFMKFVPASGAATRMFQSLYVARERPEAELRAVLDEAASAELEGLFEFVRFMAQRERLPFFKDWRAVCRERGRELGTMLENGCYHAAMDCLLHDDGLGYGRIPKALIPFHGYQESRRTALEEHLVEAALYVRDADGNCGIHFTVGEKDEKRFRDFVSRVRPTHESRLGCVYRTSFSVQQPSTDTVAVDSDNRPLRDEAGHLLLRPSGHGALLNNLNELQGDLVYIKNIDNVVPDHLEETSTLWKKVLGGFLVETQRRVHGYVNALREGMSESLAAEVLEFLKTRFHFQGETDLRGKSLNERRRILLDRLDRPIRVCGMVQNVGEPGGGPFWVRDKDGGVSVQIVEKAQVHLDDPDQERIWSQSTHFNPVDLVCGLRDATGKCFDLRRFRDPEAVFITRKSRHGRELKALELPGLWNGAMAYWNTLLVEVPRLTFNPVKTVNDLLRPEHQPPEIG